MKWPEHWKFTLRRGSSHSATTTENGQPPQEAPLTDVAMQDPLKADDLPISDILASPALRLAAASALTGTPTAKGEPNQIGALPSLAPITIAYSYPAPLLKSSSARPSHELAPAPVFKPTPNPPAAVPHIAEVSFWPPALFKPSLGVKMSAIGRVEVLSTEFALGWAAVTPTGSYSHVLALLDGEVIGASVARFGRADLDRARSEGTMNAYVYVVVFSRKVEPERVRSIKIVSPGAAEPLLEAREVRVDRSPILRVFLLGSPRSGTSELGTTLTKVLGIPWMGEGHAAPLLSAAADALTGDPAAPNGMVRFMGREHFRDIAIAAAKQAYFCNHGWSSFLDKTPGIPMISAVPFLLECFPNAKFIFLRRNPIANILSRMAKFGGSFDNHCRDWAATMMQWARIRAMLPHYLEIDQERMEDSPGPVAIALGAYLGEPNVASKIEESLSTGTRERTGAGVGKSRISDTQWTESEITTFKRLCSPAMDVFGYRFDEVGSLRIS